METNEILKELIKKSRIQQNEICEALGISRVTLHRWLNNPNLEFRNFKLVQGYIQENLTPNLSGFDIQIKKSEKVNYKEKYFEILEKYTELMEKTSKRPATTTGQMIQKNK
jgi:transcriptional regulator with XRE-family HTH domain